MSQPDGTANSQVLYIVSCAAPPALDVHILIELAQQDGWEVCLIATPRAFQWIDVAGLSEQTGHPALAESIARLRRSGVRVLFGPDVLPLHRPRQGKRDQFPGT